MPRQYRNPNPRKYRVDEPEFRVIERKRMPQLLLDNALCHTLGKSFTDDAYNDDDHSAIERAKSVCRRCPVRLECCQYAIEIHERYGVWGGLTSGQREREFASPWASTRQLPVACQFCNRPFIPGRHPLYCRKRACDYARGLARTGLL